MRRVGAAGAGWGAAGLAAGWGAAAATGSRIGDPWKLSTFSLMIRPPGPVPRTWRRSIPRSAAMRRASGDALTRPSPFCSPPCSAGCGVDSACCVSARDSAVARATACGPPSSAGACCAPAGGALASAGAQQAPIRAIGVPIGTSCPSGTRIFCSMPLSNASSSIVALSVSISAMISPLVT